MLADIRMRTTMTNYRQNYLFLCLFLLSTALFAQSDPVYEVRGTVRDSLANETLPFASVFFSGTTYGTTTDKDGNYSLKADTPGTYDLVISFMGYATFFRQIDLNKPGTVELNVAMTTDAKLIGGVTVTAKKDEKWRKNLATFKKTFLGTSENAENCVIVNEEILNFDYDPKTRIFEAYAGEPLIIENKSLGYRLKYVLENFAIYYEYNFSTFYGFPSYEDMTKKGKTPRKRWLKARNKAYNGSVEHFMRSLYAGKTYEEGFRINLAKDVEGMGRVFDSNEFKINDIVKSASDGVRKEFSFENYLYITYMNETPSPMYFLRRSQIPAEINKGTGQMSWISMASKDAKVEFEKSGYMINPLSIVLEGYWGFEKVADLLPTNYQPVR